MNAIEQAQAAMRPLMNAAMVLPEVRPNQAVALLRIAEIDRLIECHKMLYERHKGEVVRLEAERSALQR